MSVEFVVGCWEFSAFVLCVELRLWSLELGVAYLGVAFPFSVCTLSLCYSFSFSLSCSLSLLLFLI